MGITLFRARRRQADRALAKVVADNIKSVMTDAYWIHPVNNPKQAPYMVSQPWWPQHHRETRLMGHALSAVGVTVVAMFMVACGVQVAHAWP